MKSQEKIWDKIAPLWHEYKSDSSPGFVTDFLKNSSGNILDLGCGSGRNFVSLNKGTIYAVDFSKNMLELAKEYAEKNKLTNIQFIKAKSEKLPFKDNFFDSGISIAVFHCINSKAKREKAIKEFYRVLKPKAQAIITVWDKNAKRFNNKPKSIEIPWTVRDEKIYRTYYLYTYEEFKSVLEKIGFKIINKIETRANIVVVVEK